MDEHIRALLFVMAGPLCILAFIIWKFTVGKEMDGSASSSHSTKELKLTQRARLAHMLEAFRSYKETVNDIWKLKKQQDLAEVKENDGHAETIRNNVNSISQNELELAKDILLEKLENNGSLFQSQNIKELQRKIDLISERRIDLLFQNEIAEISQVMSIQDALARQTNSSVPISERNPKRPRDNENSGGTPKVPKIIL